MIIQNAKGDREVIEAVNKGVLTGKLLQFANGSMYLGEKLDPDSKGLFGTLGGSAFINLPTYTWPNPHPEKTISTIEARSGSSSEMVLLVFGVTLE